MVEPSRAYRRILCPTDLSATSAEAAGRAAGLSRTHSAELVLLHVIADPADEVTGERSREGRDVTGWALWRVAKADIDQRLEALARRHDLEPGRYEILSSFGDPAARILEIVRERTIDLIVLSARRDRSLLGEMLLGSVAYRVVRTAPCDVLVVR